MELLFGSTNPGKLRELVRLVEGLAVRVVTPAELGRPLPEVVEDGATFRENAEKKARAFAAASGRLALADDSGLCVDALGGAPGVHSARWSEETAPGPLPREARDRANNERLLAALASEPEARRGAAYVAVLSLAGPDGVVVASVEGTCRGRIERAPRGAGGFGYDPLFVPDSEWRRAEGQPEEAGPERAPGEEPGSAWRRAEAQPKHSEGPGGPVGPEAGASRAEGQPEEAGPERAPGEEPGSAWRRAEAQPKHSEGPGGPVGPEAGASRAEGQPEEAGPERAPGGPGGPVGPPRTMSELSATEKDALSHRGAAFRALRPVLARLAALDVPRGNG